MTRSSAHIQRCQFLPDGGESFFWHADDGHALRVVRWQPANAKALIFLLNGRGDFVEKFSETIADCLDFGYGVVSFDWRGQGLSGRLGVQESCHIDGFERHLRDAQGIIDASVHPFCQGLPVYILAHSMGAHLALRLLHDQDTALENPKAIARAVLVAPMLGIFTTPIPEPLARRWIAWQARRSMAKHFAPGQGIVKKMLASPLRMQRLTSDPDRFADEAAILARNPDLGVGGVTFGWLAAAFASIDVMRAPGYAQAISTPCLLLVPEREKLVRPQATLNFAQKMPHGHAILFHEARHELLKERDDLRQQALRLMADFLDPARSPTSFNEPAPR
jgi:lysophospholipase